MPSERALAALREVWLYARELHEQTPIDPRSGTHRGRMYEKHIQGAKANCAHRLDAILRRHGFLGDADGR